VRQGQTADRPRGRNLKVYIRAWIAMTLIAAWSLAALSGFLLWLAPSGPRSGWQVLFLGLTKRQWGDVHFWVSVAALGVTIAHVIIDRRALYSCIRHLTSIQRRQDIGG
jgi:hypothetical protein